MTIKGNELKITPASFAEAMALQKAIGRALKGTKMELPEDIKAELTTDMLSGIIDAVLGVATSDDVETCLFECAKRCIVGTDKIDREFFEDPENRQFFYPVMVEIIKTNVGPFFKGLDTQLLGLAQKVGNLRG